MTLGVIILILRTSIKSNYELIESIISRIRKGRVGVYKYYTVRKREIA